MRPRAEPAMLDDAPPVKGAVPVEVGLEPVEAAVPEAAPAVPTG
jgi:hypothetical protein